jgi:hypothetical protein
MRSTCQHSNIITHAAATIMSLSRSISRQFSLSRLIVPRTSSPLASRRVRRLSHTHARVHVRLMCPRPRITYTHAARHRYLLFLLNLAPILAIPSHCAAHVVVTRSRASSCSDSSVVPAHARVHVRLMCPHASRRIHTRNLHFHIRILLNPDFPNPCRLVSTVPRTSSP